MADPALSVVVCTLDRAELLRGCLDALEAEQAEDGSVEVIVVDNGSTDETPAVVGAHAGIRYVLEPWRGLARARNTGLAAARGALVAFVDDDARPDAGWAGALLIAHDRWPTAVALGGPVRLEWGAPRPAWLVAELAGWFSAIDHGPDARLLAPHEQLVGTNMAVARERALAIGGFATELGRVGASLASEEELHLLRRLRSDGAVAWAPGAAVRHLVPADRMTRRWLLRRAWAQGRSDTVAARLDGVPAPRDRRSAVRAATRGWRTAAREIRGAEVPSGQVVRELVRRARRVAQVV
jgi:hypothetical protein